MADGVERYIGGRQKAFCVEVDNDVFVRLSSYQG